MLNVMPYLRPDDASPAFYSIPPLHPPAAVFLVFSDSDYTLQCLALSSLALDQQQIDPDDLSTPLVLS